MALAIGGQRFPAATESPFKARGDHREYNVYVQTAKVEAVWPRIPDWPLAPWIGPLLVSLEIVLKILEDTLDEAGTREYMNDAAKVDVVAASVAAVLTLIADIAFEHEQSARPPETVFGPPSRTSAWNRVMKKLERVANGTRIRATLRSQHDLAALPLLPELTTALDRLTLWTNLAFADHSGIVIREQEREHGAAAKYDYRLPAAPCDPALMTATAEKYFAAIREQKKEEWKALFAESLHFEDPRGTKPYVTEWNLDVFFRNFQKLFPKVLGAEHRIVDQGYNHLKVAWTLEAESFLTQIVVRFSGTETFYFDPEGRISVAFAEWDPAAVAAEIMQRHRASLAEAAGGPVQRAE